MHHQRRTQDFSKHHVGGPSLKDRAQPKLLSKFQIQNTHWLLIIHSSSGSSFLTRFYMIQDSSTAVAIHRVTFSMYTVVVCCCPARRAQGNSIKNSGDNYWTRLNHTQTADKFYQVFCLFPKFEHKTCSCCYRTAVGQRATALLRHLFLESGRPPAKGKWSVHVCDHACMWTARTARWRSADRGKSATNNIMCGHAGRRISNNTIKNEYKGRGEKIIRHDINLNLSSRALLYNEIRRTHG